MFTKGNQYYRIANPPDVINIYYKEYILTHSVKLYFQYEGQAGDLAGDLNVYYNN